MSTTKRYIVAGHAFTLTLPENPELWKALGQYEPFEAEEGDSLFELELVRGLPELEAETVYDSPTEDGETVIRLMRAGSGEWLIEMKPDHRMPVSGRLLCSADFSSARLKLETASLLSAVFCINNSAMVLYAFTTYAKNTLEMHASVVRKDGRAYIFLGRSGTGKSTHSSLWLKYLQGCELMNDGLHMTMEGVVAGVPFYLLDCRPDEEAAKVCSETVCK